MNKSLLEDKIAKRAKTAFLNDKILKTFIMIFILAYLFFFSSTLILPKNYKNVHPTPLGTTYELGDYVITYDAWDWSKKDKVFEIILEIENLSLEKEPLINFVIQSGEDIYKVNIEKVFDDSIYVLSVNGVKKRFTTATLMITTYDEYGENAKSNKIVIDDRKVGTLTSATTETDYKKYIANNKIKGYKSRIKELLADQKEYAEKITYSYEKVEKLELKKKTQTDEEQMETEQNISMITNEANELQAFLDDTALEIQNLKDKIDIQYKILKDLERK